MRIAWIVVAFALINAIFWNQRLTAFRKDAGPWDLNIDILNPANYRPEGRRTFAAFVGAITLFWVATLAALYLTWGT